MREFQRLTENDETLIMSRLVGRDAEASALSRAIDEARLVGVSGPPGVGKSTLARYVVGAKANSVAVSLAGQSDESHCLRSILKALGTAVPPDEGLSTTWARLERVLAEQPRVVLLDDADGWRELEKRLDTSLRGESQSTFVVTRQAALRSASALHVKLSGLSTLEGCELFTSSSSTFDASTAPPHARRVIEAIVEEVDGNPLAIELAASRTLIMSPEQILQRLESSLEVLRSSRHRDPRHQSLEAALDLAWKRLSTDQRIVHMAASRLGNTLDLEALEFVCTDLVQAPCPDILEELIMDSMIETRTGDGRIGFHISGAIRAYSLARLAESAADSIGERSRAWFLSQARQTARELEGGGATRAFGRLQSLTPAFIQEVHGCIDSGQHDQAGNLLAALRHVALMRGPLDRFTELFEGLEYDALEASTRASLASFEAELRLVQGDRLGAEDLARRRLEEQPSDTRARLQLIRILAMTRPPSQAEEAETMLRDALEVARSSADRFMEARLIERLGFLAIQTNRVDRAWIEFSEARQIFDLLGTPVFLGDTTTGLGYVELRKNRLSEASERLREAVRLHEELDNDFHLAAARFNLGVVLHAGGHLEEAREELTAASDSWKRGGFIHHRSPALVRLGLVEVEAGRLEEARRLFSEVIHLAASTSDHHNGAIAVAERAAIDHFSDRPIDIARVEGALQGMLVGADPDAFASALTLLTVVSGREKRPRLPYVNRLEELVALFAEDDDYSRSTVMHLRDVSRAWHLMSLAQRQPESAGRESHLAAAHDAVSELLEPGDQGTNSFVRIWVGRLRDSETLGDFSPAEASDQPRLLLHRDGSWYAIDDLPPVDLSTRRPLSLLMRKFAQCIDEGRVEGLDVDELADAGWPGEPLTLSTRRNRVYTAIRFLREMDLEEILVTSESGYRFAPDIVVRLTDERLHA